MEVDSRPVITSSQMSHHPHTYHGQQHDRSYQHHLIHRSEDIRQPLPPASSLRSPTGLASVSSVLNTASGSPGLPAVHTAQPGHYNQASPDVVSAPANPPQFLPPTPNARFAEQQSPVAHAFPRPSTEVSLDAIERLQTQISQNSGALAAQTRDIRQGEESIRQLEAGLRREFAAQVQRQALDIQRIDEAVGRMQIDMHSMHQAMETIARDIAIVGAERQRAAVLPPAHTTFGQDSALEIMAQQLTLISHKANEIDTFKIAIEILKNKVKRLEDVSMAQAGPTPANSKPRHTLQEPSAPVLHSVPQQSSHQSSALAEPPTTTPVQPPATLRSQLSGETSSSTATPEVSHRPEPLRASTGWTAINAGIKRPNSSVMDTSIGAANDLAGSPKKQKLVRLDSTPALVSQPHAPVDVLAPMTPDNRIPSTMPVQQSFPGVTPASQQPTYDPYGLHTDSWRSEPHRTTEHRPRGRPRGSGIGSRGGRARKSLPPQGRQPGSPEWEKHEFDGLTMSQVSPNEYYNHVSQTPRGIARRGSGGGGGRGSYTPSDRAVSLGLQGVSVGMGSPMGSANDPYSHTKKTRSKPIRNADGVLIRKDGRPDMRSQSSAANLRKVHARKEEEPAGLSPSASTPTNLHHSISIDAAHTPSPPVPTQQDRQDVTASVHKKHKSIMGKMFPEGLDESRKQHDYAHQVFEDDHDHTAQPRARRHSTSRVQHPVKAPMKDRDATTEADGPVSAQPSYTAEENGEIVPQSAQPVAAETTRG